LNSPSYRAPNPKTEPLVQYLESQSNDALISHEDAVTRVTTLLKEKQCYTYAFERDAVTFKIEPESRKVTLNST